MKNFALCYSEHAIKVSDSYCSGPSNKSYTSPHSIPSIQDSVSCVYIVKLSNEKQFRIRITWRNPLMGGCSMAISDYPFSKFSDSLMLRKAKGTENFEYCGMGFEVSWDLFRAEYEGTVPEPICKYYFMVLVNSEMGLILGDMEEDLEIEKRKMLEFSLVSRRVHFSGNGIYTTRAIFCEKGKYHDILIEYKNLILYVYIDQKSVIEVKRLQWNFRGNQIIFLDGLLIDVMWDVHDWFFSAKSGHGVFMFRTRSGLDNRLWFEEKSFYQMKEQEKASFSLLISACKNPD